MTMPAESESLCDRIKRHYTPGIRYRELMLLVFPEDVYPRAWRYQSNGGPPGCSMAFGKALKKLGLARTRDPKNPDLIYKTQQCEF